MNKNALKYIKNIYLSRILTKPVYMLCEQREGDSADAFMWSDQRLLLFATF